MDQNLDIYLVVLALGIGLTLIVGQILIRTGRTFLEGVFDERRTASSASRLIAVLFHLVVLGALALISTVDVGGVNATQIVVTKLGIILLVLAAAYGLTLLGLIRIRNRHREEDVQEELSSQFEAARTEYGAPAVPRPVIEMGRGGPLR